MYEGDEQHQGSGIRDYSQPLGRQLPQPSSKYYHPWNSKAHLSKRGLLMFLSIRKYKVMQTPNSPWSHLKRIRLCPIWLTIWGFSCHPSSCRKEIVGCHSWDWHLQEAKWETSSKPTRQIHKLVCPESRRKDNTRIVVGYVRQVRWLGFMRFEER